MERLILEFILGLAVFAAFYVAAVLLKSRAKKRPQTPQSSAAPPPDGTRKDFGLRK